MKFPHEVVKANLLEGKSLARAWREYLGFSQKDIAKKMEISQATLSQIEKQASTPRATTLEKLANALGIDKEQLTD